MAFSGSSGSSFEASYVDLSEWMDKDIRIRFRFSCIVDTVGGIGWLMDDIEFMDLLAYNSEACVTSAQGDYQCVSAPEAGTIVDSRAEPLGTAEQVNGISADIFPNPATDLITVEMTNSQAQHIDVSLLTADGRVLWRQTPGLSGKSTLHIDTSNFPAGLYFVKICSPGDCLVEKVAIQK